MRKYMLLAAIITILTVTITACDAVGETTGLSEISTTNTFIDPGYNDYRYQAPNEGDATTSWQEAYANKLNHYSHEPATTEHIPEATWRFMLHDVNQSGIPQLFLVRYHNGQINHHATYTLYDGEAIQLKAAPGVDVLHYGGMYIAPGGTGIIRYVNTGWNSLYEKLRLSTASLSRATSGDTSAIVESFRINAFPVTQEEFEYTFGCPEERVWLVLNEITPANIQDIVFAGQ